MHYRKNLLTGVAASISLAMGLAACQPGNGQSLSAQQNTPAEVSNDAIFYSSLNYAVNEGEYDGVMTVGELKKKGSMGVGSTAQLTYEMVIADSVVYGIPSDGKAVVLDDTTRVVYAAVKHFTPDQTLEINESMSRKEFEDFLAEVVHQNAFAAIAVEGTFEEVEYRTFVPQRKPYKPVDQAETEIYTKEDISGIFSGFYTPESAQVLNSPVFHFHFISQHQETGGHALEYTVAKATVAIDYAKNLEVHLADTTELQDVDLNQAVNK